MPPVESCGAGSCDPGRVRTSGVGGRRGNASSKVSRSQLVVNLVAGGLGTGILSLPWCMAGASLVPGVLMTLGVVALNACTIMILVEAAEAKQVFDLGSLVGLLPGKLAPGRLGDRLPSLGVFMQGFMNVTVWIALLGSLISYLIAMHDSAMPFVSGTPFATHRWPLITIAAAVVLPLCFLDQRYLSFTSTVAFAVNVYLIIVLSMEFAHKASAGELPGDSCLVGAGRGSIAMLAALAQCIIIQMCVLPMYEELEERSPMRFAKALWSAFGALAVIFSFFAALGYLTFGPEVRSNVLVSLPKGGAADLAQLGTIAVVAAVYPIMVIPMIAPLKNMDIQTMFGARAIASDADANRWKRGLITCAIFVIVGISYVGALLIDSLGFINVVDGALCVGAFTALVPSLVGLRLLSRSSLTWRFLMFTLLILGLTNAALGLYFSDNYKEDIMAHCAVTGHGGVAHARRPLAPLRVPWTPWGVSLQ